MRGIRNNNPLNIRHSADQWQGARAEQTDKVFVQFTSMAYGYRAAWKVLDTYCLTFKRERKAYNVRNIIGRWAPPTENNTGAYVRSVVMLSGLGGNENMPRPKRYRAFNEVEKLVSLIAAMTCVENGIRLEQVDRKAIWEGYDLAFPEAKRCEKGGATQRPPVCSPIPLQIVPYRLPDEVKKIGPHWDEYWDWSPMAYTGDGKTV